MIPAREEPATKDEAKQESEDEQLKQELQTAAQELQSAAALERLIDSQDVRDSPIQEDATVEAAAPDGDVAETYF